MKRIGAGLLLGVGVGGLIVGFVIDQVLTASGRPTFTPSLLLPVLFILLAISIVVLALPIYRATRATTRPGAAPVDPFHAVRIAVLARSCSIVGAAITGVGAGMGVFLATRPVAPSLGSTGAVIAAIVGAVALMVAGLVAEHLCTIRKDDDDDHPGPPEPGYGLSHHD